MNKRDLVDAVAVHPAVKDLPKPRQVAQAAVDALVDVTRRVLLDGKDELRLNKLFTIGTREVPQRERRNPNNGEVVVVPAGRAPYVRVSEGIRRALRGQPVG